MDSKVCASAIPTEARTRGGARPTLEADAVPNPEIETKASTDDHAVVGSLDATITAETAETNARPFVEIQPEADAWATMSADTRATALSDTQACQVVEANVKTATGTNERTNAQTRAEAEAEVKAEAEAEVKAEDDA